MADVVDIELLIYLCQSVYFFQACGRKNYCSDAAMGKPGVFVYNGDDDDNDVALTIVVAASAQSSPQSDITGKWCMRCVSLDRPDRLPIHRPLPLLQTFLPTSLLLFIRHRPSLNFFAIRSYQLCSPEVKQLFFTVVFISLTLADTQI